LIDLLSWTNFIQKKTSWTLYFFSDLGCKPGRWKETKKIKKKTLQCIGLSRSINRIHIYSERGDLNEK